MSGDSNSINAQAAFSAELIDYAGLFPPAALPFDQVVANFSKYLNGPNAKMLGRLVMPAAKLAEFERLAASDLPTRSGQPVWRISALVPQVDAAEQAFDFSLSGIRQFNSRHIHDGYVAAVVDAIEIKAPTGELIRESASRLRNEPLNVFFEVPHNDDPSALINTIADENSHSRFFAKIRTGGVTADLIPDCAKVARFIDCCADNLLGMKATAGLHHPVRSEFNLTYDQDADRAVMHGFVNVFSAMCAAYGYGCSREQLTTILESTDPACFAFDGDRFKVPGLDLSARKIAAIRSKFAVSFGSCSFDEPRTELTEVVSISGSALPAH